MRCSVPPPVLPASSTSSDSLRSLVVGAGVSGIFAAHPPRATFPDRSVVLLDAQDARGGT